jgi:hypothetical protein
VCEVCEAFGVFEVFGAFEVFDVFELFEAFGGPCTRRAARGARHLAARGTREVGADHVSLRA